MQEQQPSVDVIMPTYNPERKFLVRAIGSVLDQTFRNWNLFVVQDGGDVDVRDMLREYRDDRISLHQLPHKGKPATLNYALAQGNGKYIAYLDDDDIWYPTHLQTAISYMTEHGAKFVHTDAYEVYVSRKEETLRETSRGLLSKGAITDITMWYISHINAVHERSLLEKTGLYDETRSFFIDWDMFQRLAREAKPNHIRVATCEHYIYLDRRKKKSNTISSIHVRDPELSRRMHYEMFKRAYDFGLVSAEGFAEFAKEWQEKSGEFEILSRSKIWKMLLSLRRMYRKIARN